MKKFHYLFEWIFFLFFLLISFSIELNAQYVRVSGFVADQTSLERLPGAYLSFEEESKGVISNGYGFYTISLPTGRFNAITCSYMGYDIVTLSFSAERDTMINFFLNPSALNLEEVTVTSRLPINRRLEMSMAEIPMKQISSLPALGGETDVLKALQLMPGIKSGNEAGSGIYVRGGSTDQNLIILDDVPLFYVNHLRDYVSIFNASALQSVQAYKGGFPARFGGRLSSVIDVRMREGDMRESHGEATIGLVTSKILYEGPLKKDTSIYVRFDYATPYLCTDRRGMDGLYILGCECEV
jgi:hypothetical protein